MIDRRHLNEHLLTTAEQMDNVHLHFDHPAVSAYLLSRCDGLVSRIHRITLRYRQAIFGKQTFGLILM